MTAEKIIERYQNAKSIRSQSDDLRYQAGRYAWPMAREIYKGSPPVGEGQIKTEDIFTSVPVNAAFKATSGIFSYLMPVGDRWFELTPQEYLLAEDENISRWLSSASQVLHDEIWRSNFQKEMFATIRSIIVFGFGVISVVKASDGGLSFRSYHVGDICFEENSDGEIDTVFRTIYFTARQAVQEFGDSVPDKIKKEAEKKDGSNTKYEFVHAVYPRQDYDKTKIDKKGMRFISQYIFIEGKDIVKDSGFDELPYLIGRFAKAPDELYGRSPVTENIPEIKMLNAMSKNFIESTEIAFHPAMMAEDDSVLGEPSQGPASWTYIRSGSQFPQPIQTGINVQLNDIILQRQERKIEESLFNHLFQTLADYRNMTATEVIGRREEALTMLSPTILGLQKELLDPLIDRCLSILLKAKKRIPDAPAEFDYDVKYQGRLSMAMSKTQADASMGHLAEWMPYTQVWPELRYAINSIKMFKQTGLNRGIKAEWMPTDEEIQMAQQQEAQASQMAQEAQVGEMASKALLNTAKAQEIGI